MDQNPTLTESRLREIAEEFVHSIAAQTGEGLDFTPESLVLLDAILGEWLAFSEAYRGEPAVDLDPLAIPVAAYIGDVLVRHRQATWESEQVVGPFPALVRCDGSRIALQDLVKSALAGTEPPQFRTLVTNPKPAS